MRRLLNFFKAKKVSHAEAEAMCALAFADMAGGGYLDHSRDDLLYGVWLNKLPDSVFRALSREETVTMWRQVSQGEAQ